MAGHVDPAQEGRAAEAFFDRDPPVKRETFEPRETPDVCTLGCFTTIIGLGQDSLQLIAVAFAALVARHG
eukprot:3724306-Heterocapsa_arctica.AAC.1